jgi:cyclopropane-fatty-acyl-phospholipid synthase
MAALFSEDRLNEGARAIFEHVAKLLDARISVRLWDGSIIPLGQHADSPFYISISGPGVIASLLRRPNFETLIRLYCLGHIDVKGGDIISFMEMVRKKGRHRQKLGQMNKGLLLRQLWPFLFVSAERSDIQHEYSDDATGRVESRRSNRDYIQFHYDISNEFYALFLDPEMLYSCAYFATPETRLAEAQKDKLDIICRKLRLKQGEKFLDIGCGWGGLICHAARYYGVQAYGVTLSQKQYGFAREKIKRLGLEDCVRIELRDYETLTGCYDKISSIGMFEHIGLDNMAKYFGKIHSLLRDRGILLNHGIARTAKASRRAKRKIRPERKLILKYIFPGSELDNVGRTVDLLQIAGFEVHDVEGWRAHYAMTCRAWHDALVLNRDEAIRQVGPEKYRMWLLYLAGVSIGFTQGSIHLYQVVASKHAAKGLSELPLTRKDLYV